MRPPQNFERTNQQIFRKLQQKAKQDRASLERRIDLSWSNWGFGQEPLQKTARRLQKNRIQWLELHGNRYGIDLGYNAAKVRQILDDHAISVAGICGMFGPDNDLSSDRGIVRQAAIDYIRRNAELGQALGAQYMLIVPGAVGRPAKIDDYEFDRSVDSLRRVADVLVACGLKGAVEPIRAAEVSFCFTFADAVRYIRAVNHPGVQHINGDIYHMLAQEDHPFQTIVKHGDRLVNLHLADTNRGALGSGMLDVDALIAALYVAGYNQPGHFATPEPLGPGGDPYPAMHGKPDSATLDALVKTTVETFRAREDAIREELGL